APADIQQTWTGAQTVPAQCRTTVCAARPQETPRNDPVVVLRATIEELVYKIRLLHLSLKPLLYYGMGQHALIRLAIDPFNIPRSSPSGKQSNFWPAFEEL